MIPLVAAPVFGFLYRATVVSLPGAFLLLSAALYLVVGALLVVVNRGVRSVEGLKQAEEEADKDDGR